MSEVEVKEDDRSIKILIKEPEKPIITGKSEPDERIIDFGVMKDGTLKVLQVEYPKTIYRTNDIKKVADDLQTLINKEGCSSCLVMSVTEKARKSFFIPTLRDILNI